MKEMTVGLVQANFRSAFDEPLVELAAFSQPREDMGPADFAYNRELFASLAQDAANSGAELVLGPESYLDGWSAKADILAKILTTIPGPETDRLSELAQKLGVWLCVGLFEKADRKMYNSAVLISSDGRLAGVYRKTHETKDVLGRMPYELGGDLPVFETPWGLAGILICHDRWYPEAARTLKVKGADFILNPTAAPAFIPGYRYHEIHLCVLSSHAYLNELFWVNCNSANHGGHSLVIGPDGNIVAGGLSGQEEVLIVKLDPSAYQCSNFFVPNLRKELYSVC